LIGEDRKWLEEGQTGGNGRSRKWLDLTSLDRQAAVYRLQSLEIPGIVSHGRSTQSVGEIRMGFSLYDATVANYVQILGAVGGFLEKSLTHFHEKGFDPAEIVETRLTPDMLPLRFQIVSVAHHSRGAMEAAKNGVFAPPAGKPDLDYAALQALVTEARNELSVLTPEAVNALVGRDLTFRLGDRALPFTTEGFLMSFSLPNFFSMRPRRTTFFAKRARRLENAISWAR
jgi:hypothetical protein